MVETIVAIIYVFIAYQTFVMVRNARDTIKDMKLDEDVGNTPDMALKIWSAIWPVYFTMTFIFILFSFIFSKH